MFDEYILGDVLNGHNSFRIMVMGINCSQLCLPWLFFVPKYWYTYFATRTFIFHTVLQPIGQMFFWNRGRIKDCVHWRSPNCLLSLAGFRRSPIRANDTKEITDTLRDTNTYQFLCKILVPYLDKLLYTFSLAGIESCSPMDICF